MKTTILSPFQNPTQIYRQTIALSLLLGLCTGCSTVRQRGLDLLNIGGSQSLANSTSKPPQVVVTNTVLCDLTKQIADSTIDLICLLSPGIDTNTYQVTPQDRQAIDRAQLVMYGGYNLEPDLVAAIKTSTNSSPKIAVHEIAVPQPQKLMEAGNSTIDPYVWHNAKNGVKIVNIISTNLQKIAPNSAAIYKKNTRKLTTEINQIDAWIGAQVDTIPSQTKTLFTPRHALGYYSKAYGLPVDALVGVSTSEEPTIHKAKNLVDKIQKAKVPTIYVELTFNPQLMKTVASEAQVKLSVQEIYANGLGDVNSSGGSYQKMLISNTKEIVTGLRGNYTPFERSN